MISMKSNKDTVKALEAATTLITYCNRYKYCKGCIFHQLNEKNNHFCVINMPYMYQEITEKN